MQIKRKFNNNVILSENKDGTEVILLGRGISVNRQIGDEVDEKEVEKVFVLEGKDFTGQFMNLLNDIPPQRLILANRIIDDAEKSMHVVFNDSIYIGLTDHLNYALDRARDKIELKNAMLWEIRRFYPKEFACARESLQTIKYYEGVWLSDDEAGYIALHFVNGQQNSEMKTTLLMTEIVKNVIKIIKFHFNINLDENSISYMRLISHLRYFTLRTLNNEPMQSLNNDSIYEILKKQYPSVYECSLKIAEYLQEELHTKLCNDELTYLMIHVSRIAARD